MPYMLAVDTTHSTGGSSSPIMIVIVGVIFAIALIAMVIKGRGGK
jgi:hypothetical protein